MASFQDVAKIYGIDQSDLINVPLAAKTILYAGAAIGITSAGYGNLLVGGQNFVGFKLTRTDNSKGVDGFIKGQVLQSGEITINVANANSAACFGQIVFGIDSNNFTIVPSPSYSIIGKIVEWISGTTCKVRFEGCQRIAVPQIYFQNGSSQSSSKSSNSSSSSSKSSSSSSKSSSSSSSKSSSKSSSSSSKSSSSSSSKSSSSSSKSSSSSSKSSHSSKSSSSSSA